MGSGWKCGGLEEREGERPAGGEEPMVAACAESLCCAIPGPGEAKGRSVGLECDE